VIRVEGLSKRYGSTLAVHDLTLSVKSGRVTGFLGPNGSGKSTTMRCIVQLDRPTAGTATINGRPFRELDRPLHEVGVLLDATYVHPGRRACDHLWAMAAANRIPRSRVDEVLGMVGLSEVGDHRVKSYSLGMRQRLGLAGVMLGDPHTVILDEPANGLDPEGIRWIRDFLAYLAKQGRTVFVSSHLLSEMSLMADHIVVIGRGRLIEEGSVTDFIGRYADRWVRIRSPRLGQLVELIRARGAVVAAIDHDAVSVRGLVSEAIGDIAAENGIPLHELAPQTGSLEDAFLALTAGVQEYRAVGPSSSTGAVPVGPPLAPWPSATPPPPVAPGTPVASPTPATTGPWAPPSAGGDT
jgi:ABC-2 type transport system ATP-binding protein